MKHNTNKISSMLVASEKFSGEDIVYFEDIESTNSWLVSQSRSGRRIDGIICLAENQTSGRGRRGKRWFTPASSSILLSLGWRLKNKNPEGLSLVSGIAVAQSLEALGVKNVKLKWPNDIMIDEKKLGGILIEITELDCVIGIGINVNIPTSFEMPVDMPWVDITSLGIEIDRDQLVAEIVLHHERLLTRHQLSGFESFVDMWNEVHVYQNQVINIISTKESLTGTALGVDKFGALLIQSNGKTHRITSGEVSVRPA